MVSLMNSNAVHITRHTYHMYLTGIKYTVCHHHSTLSRNGKDHNRTNTDQMLFIQWAILSTEKTWTQQWLGNACGAASNEVASGVVTVS